MPDQLKISLLLFYGHLFRNVSLLGAVASLLFLFDSSGYRPPELNAYLFVLACYGFDRIGELMLAKAKFLSEKARKGV